MLAFALIPASLAALVTTRLHHSLVPDDPYAFPKYRVTFLNGLPILNETVHRWMQDGLRGGESEFLDQPWEQDLWYSPVLQRIEGTAEGQEDLTSKPSLPLKANNTLELMKFGRNSYLCLIPPAPEEPIAPAVEESAEVTPGHGWSLLQPLSGSCLYHRHGWFTYSYCHNSHVRQFRELVHAPGHRTGEYKPEEDPEWEAYTLGRAPPTLDPGADLTVAEEAALAANVELARGAGSRYLVQRWGDGTYCDKTGRKREIEVQFHCSMTMTDTIVFIKETQTCHYILHIATPRLCGEPGFKNRLDAREEAYIRCREVLSAEAYEAADRSLPPADHPYKFPKRTNKPVIAPPPPPGTTAQDPTTKDKKDTLPKLDAQLLKNKHELIRKALERMMADGELKSGEVFIEPLGDGEEEIVIEFIDATLEDGESEDEYEQHTEGGTTTKAKKPKTTPDLAEVLRLAGYDLKEQKKKDVTQSQEQERKEDKKSQRDRANGRGMRRNEL